MLGKTSEGQKAQKALLEASKETKECKEIDAIKKATSKAITHKT